MPISIKQPTSCKRKEISTFYTFLGNLTLENNQNRLNKFKKIALIGFYKKNNEIAGMSIIKKPSKKRIEKINMYSKGKIKKNSLEYGYIYVNPKYRGQGITKKIYQELLPKIKNNLYATTKENNLPMQKILSQLGYTKKGEFTSNIDGKNIFIYGK